PAHAFLHRRDELVRNRAALHAVHEFEAGAARQRLDLQEHLAELAGAAGLLLVAAMVSRNGIDGGLVSSSSLYWLDIFSRIALRCISPRPRMTVSFACELCSMRKHGSSATILCSTSETFCSSPRFFGCTARPKTEVGSSSGLACTCASSAESCST